MAQEKVVYPARPFHVWETKAKKDLRWRYYSDKNRASIGALMAIKWAEVGTSYEVYDTRTGKVSIVYSRRVNRIDFTGDR